MVENARNLYEVLGIPSDASDDTIRQVVSDQANLWNQRKGMAVSTEKRREAEDMVNTIAEARRILLNPEERRSHDQIFNKASASLNARPPSAENVKDGQTKRPCPYCSELIAITAKKCRWCNEWLDKSQEPISSSATAPLQSSAQTAGVSGALAGADKQGVVQPQLRSEQGPGTPAVTAAKPFETAAPQSTRSPVLPIALAAVLAILAINALLIWKYHPWSGSPPPVQQDAISKQGQAIIDQIQSSKRRAPTLSKPIPMTRTVPGVAATSAPIAYHPYTPPTIPYSPTEIRDFMSNWANAWSSLNADRYIYFYDGTFSGKTDGQWYSYSGWYNLKKGRAGQKSWIRISVPGNIQITPGSDHLTLEFTQIYESSNYSDHTRKRMQLLRRNGEWKIMREEEI